MLKNNLRCSQSERLNLKRRQGGEGGVCISLSAAIERTGRSVDVVLMVCVVCVCVCVSVSESSEGGMSGGPLGSVDMSS